LTISVYIHCSRSRIFSIFWIYLLVFTACYSCKPCLASPWCFFMVSVKLPAWVPCGESQVVKVEWTHVTVPIPSLHVKPSPEVVYAHLGPRWCKHHLTVDLGVLF
jgi:hypothetical protein